MIGLLPDYRLMVYQMTQDKQEASEARQRAINYINKMGAAKPGKNDPNDTMLDYISRAVMRNPSDEGLVLLVQIKQALEELFKPLSDKQIEWIFEHCKESRGFIRKIDTSGNKIPPHDALKQWFSDEHHPSGDLSIINGIIAGLSYAAYDLGLDVMKDSNYTLFKELSAAKDICTKLMSGTPFSDAYLPERGEAILKWKHGGEARLRAKESLEDSLETLKKNAITDPNTRFVAPAMLRNLSMASFYNLNYANPEQEKETTRRIFVIPAKKEILGRKTYAEVADNRKRLFGHFSANTSSALFIVNELLKNYSTSKNPPELTAIEATVLSGLIAAEYNRARFHSPEEVFLGYIIYVLKFEPEFENKNKDELGKALYDCIPYLLPCSNREMIELTGLSLAVMANSCSDELQNAILTLETEIAHHPDMDSKGVYQHDVSRLQNLFTHGTVTQHKQKISEILKESAASDEKVTENNVQTNKVDQPTSDKQNSTPDKHQFTRAKKKYQATLQDLEPEDESDVVKKENKPPN